MTQDVKIVVYYKNTLKRLLIHEKLIFLRKCIELNLLLNSNKVKGIDPDLLLNQQKRKLFKQFNEMELQTRNNKMLFEKLSFNEKKSAKKVIYKTKCKYKRKIIWLATKQQKTNKCTNNALKLSQV